MPRHDESDEIEYEDSRVDARYLGEAGEHLTAGQLLLNGFNVFKGAVDDGVDLVGFRDGRFYNFQIKTCQDNDAFDSGVFTAKVNLDTLSRHDLDITYCVFVIHYLGATVSVDNEGQHTKYNQDFIVVPARVLLEAIGKETGKRTVKILSAYANGQITHDYIYKMVVTGQTLVLDDYLFDEFAQVK